MELIESDLKMIIDVFARLDDLAAISGVSEVEIRIKNECGDTIVIGYGENGDPAVLDVELPDEMLKITYPTPTPIYPLPTYPAPNIPWITWNTNTGDPPPDSGYRNTCCQVLDGTDADYDQLNGDRY